jgi:hypothetical protein
VPDIEGVVNEDTPLPPVNNVEVRESAYQSTTEPAGAVALRSTVPVPHLDAFVAMGATGKGMTVTCTELEIEGAHTSLLTTAL